MTATRTRGTRWLVTMMCLWLPATAIGAEGLLHRLMRVLGMSSAPAQMRGADSPASAGQIWIAELAGQASPRALTAAGGYRSPVFDAAGSTVLALSGKRVVRIAADSGKSTEEWNAPGIQRLVGVDGQQPDEVLVVREDRSAPLGMLSLTTHKVTPLPAPDRADKQQVEAVAAAAGQTRIYGSVRLFLQTKSRVAMEGKRVWQDVYVQEGSQAPRSISRCQDVTCDQPSLSPNGKQVVYVRSDTTDD